MVSAPRRFPLVGDFVFILHTRFVILDRPDNLRSTMFRLKDAETLSSRVWFYSSSGSFVRCELPGPLCDCTLLLTMFLFPCLSLCRLPWLCCQVLESRKHRGFSGHLLPLGSSPGLGVLRGQGNSREDSGTSTCVITTACVLSAATSTCPDASLSLMMMAWPSLSWGGRLCR